MKKIKKKYWVGIVSLVAVSALVAVLVMTFAGAQEEADYSGFAKCLTDNGLVFYGTDWCGHCQDQKEMFGKDIDLIDFVNCDFEWGTCTDAGVRGYPTWGEDGKIIAIGTQSFQNLADFSGCELP